ncbi:site-specific tyrosine recombinase/integron integrase [Candidatus Ruminimicrobium bovinum]|uniref:site-specific tyrosine recombinase/integron integrase n=1 Tax=Candidatus Ruminimicrobium bovinum TaxID=3242779 RepID=UPI0039B8E998
MNTKAEISEIKEITEFIKYLQGERNYSKLTAKSYKTDMYLFVDFLNTNYNGVGLTKCSRNIIRAYLAYLYNQKLQKSSIIRKFATLRSFYKFLVLNSYIEINPISAMSTPKAEKKIPKFLTEQDMLKLFDMEDISLRDRAMLELLYSSGIRIEEMVSLNLKDIDLLYGTVKVFGKGSTERIVPIGYKCCIAIKKYLDQRKQTDGFNSPLFLNKDNVRITSRGARKILHNWFVKAGFIKKVSPHTIRHSFATHLLDRGCDIKSVQQMLGHKNLATTQIYTHVTLESLRKVYDKTHPRV